MSRVEELDGEDDVLPTLNVELGAASTTWHHHWPSAGAGPAGPGSTPAAPYEQPGAPAAQPHAPVSIWNSNGRKLDPVVLPGSSNQMNQEQMSPDMAYTKAQNRDTPE